MKTLMKTNVKTVVKTVMDFWWIFDNYEMKT